MPIGVWLSVSNGVCLSVSNGVCLSEPNDVCVCSNNPFIMDVSGGVFYIFISVFLSLQQLEQGGAAICSENRGRVWGKF